MGTRGEGASRSTLVTCPLLVLLLISCASDRSVVGGADLRSTASSPTIRPLSASSSPANTTVPVFPVDATWQIQYSGKLEVAPEVDVFNLDLFDAPASILEELHRRGVFVICYFSAGSYEDWRPDAADFPPAILGEGLAGWPGEKWLDISRLDLLAPIMESRIGIAVKKGCDGVDPDNVDGYINDTGFQLSPQDQLAYNIFLSNAAHAHGLAIGLKNDMDQIPALEPYFDWMLNEECFTYQECELLRPFARAGKPVLVIEYEVPPDEFCGQAEQMGFNAVQKNRELDAYTVDCRSFLAEG